MLTEGFAKPQSAQKQQSIEKSNQIEQKKCNCRFKMRQFPFLLLFAIPIDCISPLLAFLFSLRVYMSIETACMTCQTYLYCALIDSTSVRLRSRHFCPVIYVYISQIHILTNNNNNEKSKRQRFFPFFFFFRIPSAFSLLYKHTNIFFLSLQICPFECATNERKHQKLPLKMIARFLSNLCEDIYSSVNR